MPPITFSAESKPESKWQPDCRNHLQQPRRRRRKQTGRKISHRLCTFPFLPASPEAAALPRQKRSHDSCRKGSRQHRSQDFPRTCRGKLFKPAQALSCSAIIRRADGIIYARRHPSQATAPVQEKKPAVVIPPTPAAPSRVSSGHCLTRSAVFLYTAAYRGAGLTLPST